MINLKLFVFLFFRLDASFKGHISSHLPHDLMAGCQAGLPWTATGNQSRSRVKLKENLSRPAILNIQMAKSNSRNHWKCWSFPGKIRWWWLQYEFIGRVFFSKGWRLKTKDHGLKTWVVTNLWINIPVFGTWRFLVGIPLRPNWHQVKVVSLCLAPLYHMMGIDLSYVIQ